MKKRMITLMLALIFALSLALPVGAVNVDTSQYYTRQENEDWYGGVYYEGDTLIVNVVDGYSIPVTEASTNRSQEIEYRQVSYSLKDLESIKSLLEPYMPEYSIAVLDANELTNQVDISLYQYTEDIMAAIRGIIPDEHDSLLNFINFEPYSILSTVGKEPPKGYLIIDNPLASLARGVSLLSGNSIKISGGYYTFGPAKSNKVGYTAGHNYSGTQNVYQYPTLSLVGTVTSRYGANIGDSGKITLNADNSCGPVVSFAAPSVGMSIKMMGAKSGATTGKITGTNATFYRGAPYAPLTGMCSGNYVTYPGDSGAGIFNGSGTVTTTYGVQSGALFYSDTGNWAGTSYFTPTTKLAS